MEVYIIQNQKIILHDGELFARIEPNHGGTVTLEKAMGGGVEPKPVKAHPGEAPKKRGRKSAAVSQDVKDVVFDEIRRGNKKDIQIKAEYGISNATYYKWKKQIKAETETQADERIKPHPAPESHMESKAVRAKDYKCQDGHNFKSTNPFETARCPECWKPAFVQL